jgi:hypothetical protein
MAWYAFRGCGWSDLWVKESVCSHLALHCWCISMISMLHSLDRMISFNSSSILGRLYSSSNPRALPSRQYHFATY